MKSFGDLEGCSPGFLDSVFVRLDVKDILRLSCVSKSLHQLCCAEHIWKQKWLHEHVKVVQHEVSQYLTPRSWLLHLLLFSQSYMHVFCANTNV